MKKIFLLTLIILLLCGCEKAVPEYLVSGVLVDKVGDEYAVYFEAIIVNTETTKQTLKILKGKGETIYSAVEDIEKQVTQPLLMSHSGVIVVSEDISQNDLREVCEYAQNSGITLSAYMIKTENADKLFETKPLSSACVGYDIMGLIKQNIRYKNRLFEVMGGDYKASLPTINVKDGGLVFEGD